MDFGLAGPGMTPEQPQPQQQSLLEMLQAGGGNAGSLIAAPPEGWQSNTAAYEQAGIPYGWITGNNMENPDALAHTMAGPQMPHGINPFTDIDYAPGPQGTSGFRLRNSDGTAGGDLFGGRQFTNPGSSGLVENFPRDIPRLLPKEYQPWLAPALMKHFYGQGYVNQRGSGVNAPWTQQYAPTPPNFGRAPYEGAWPGTASYDPWGRQTGAQALYS